MRRFYVGRRLSTLRPEWWSLTSNSVPNAVLLSKFYFDCISVLSSLCLTDENFNSETFYNLLLSKESSSPLLSHHWTPVLGLGFSPTNLWSRVRDNFSENFKEDILWLIILRGIKVRDSLTRWGYIASPQCSLADARPSIIVFCIVLESNVFGLISLLCYPRSLVGSLLVPLLLSFSFAGLIFPLRDLQSRASLSRPSFTGFGFSEISLPFET